MEEPKSLSAEVVKELLSGRPKAPAVTIYLPTHVSASPPHMSEDQIRLKNLRNEAEKIIITRDDGKEFIKEFLTSIDGLMSNTVFWEHQNKGLLICVRPGLFEMFYLPFDTQEYLAVDDAFHLAPIFGLLNNLKEFYVLSLAQHNPELYQGNFYGLHVQDIGLPETLEKALLIDEMGQANEKQGSVYGNTRGYNARGGDKHPAEDERQRFWRLIDKRINKHTDRKLPLILAGIESEVSEFRAHSHYPKLLDGHIEGSFTNINGNELLEPSRLILNREIVMQEQDEVLNEYSQLKGRAMTANEFAAITKAADEGRVDKLLLSGYRITTDTVRDNSEPVPVISLPPEESAQAVNYTTSEVWRMGGKVINLEEEQMPVKHSLMLAIMRY